MILGGLVLEQDTFFAIGVGDVRVGGDMEAGDDRVVAAVGFARLVVGDQVFFGVVIDVEDAGGGIVGREGETEQATFVARTIDAAGDVQKGLRRLDAILPNENFAAFFDDKETVATVARVGQMDREGRRVGDLDETEEGPRDVGFGGECRGDGVTRHKGQ